MFLNVLCLETFFFEVLGKLGKLFLLKFSKCPVPGSIQLQARLIQITIGLIFFQAKDQGFLLPLKGKIYFQNW